jgi:hypothetical protein
MATHTPGPWEDLSDGHWASVRTTHHAGHAIDCNHSGKNAAEDCANARLIAAAPDLLAALKAARDWDTLAADGISDPVLSQITAAIAKAEGQ